MADSSDVTVGDANDSVTRSGNVGAAKTKAGVKMAVISRANEVCDGLRM